MTESLRSTWGARLDGALIPAVPVPLYADAKIHTAAQQGYAEHMAAQPIGGVAVWAHTGRGLMLTPAQRRVVMDSWRRTLPAHLPVIAGVGGKSTEDTLRMAEEAAEGGADILMAYAPAFLRGQPDQDRLVVEHHRRLAAMGKPLLLFYLYEAAGGISYSPAVLAELFSLPEVVGIKMATLDSVMTFQDVANQIRTAHPDVTLITGEDRFLGYSLMAGARGALIGMGADCTAMQADLLKAWRDGDYNRFIELNRRVDAYAQVTFVGPMEGYIQRMLWSLCLRGIIPEEAVNDPWGPPVTRDEIEALRRVLKEVGQHA